MLLGFWDNFVIIFTGRRYSAHLFSLLNIANGSLLLILEVLPHKKHWISLTLMD